MSWWGQAAGRTLAWRSKRPPGKASSPVVKRVSRQAWPSDEALATGKQLQFWAEHRALSLSSQYLSVRGPWERWGRTPLEWKPDNLRWESADSLPFGTEHGLRWGGECSPRWQLGSLKTPADQSCDWAKGTGTQYSLRWRPCPGAASTQPRDLGWRWVTRPQNSLGKALQETLSCPVTAQLFSEDQDWSQPSNYTLIHSTTIPRAYSCFSRLTLCSPPFGRVSVPSAPFTQAPRPPTPSTCDTLPNLPMVDFSLS